MNTVFSPPRREKARAADESHLPQGDCRYILLHPEGKGRRCACVGFALNRSIPGSTCDCGHQACYHEVERVHTVGREEYEDLKSKFTLMEQELARLAGRNAVDRIGRLEEQVDNGKAEVDAEFRRINQAISGVYYHIGLLNKRAPYYEDHIDSLHDDVQRLDARVIDLDDASMRVEDRVEALEKVTAAVAAPILSNRRKASTPPSTRMDDLITTEESEKWEDESVATSRLDPRSSLHLVGPEEASHIQSFRERVSSVGSGSQAWTVHISLLPTSSQPFPFEKDTAAYKRCLSRGLHQVLVIPDTDSHSFKTSVDEAFSDILRGRAWQPLVARLCDAKDLLGLPMLRRLPDYLIGSDYDAAFLQRHCAVKDPSGKILDLYIAMSEHTISWVELKKVRPFKSKLEDAWVYDHLLDGPSDALGLNDDDSDVNRPAAGDIVPTWSPTLKRSASEITRASSFGSTADSEGNRAKIRRQCTSTVVEIVGRRAEAV